MFGTNLPNPKLGSFPRTDWSALFPYYAGFTEQFAAHVMDSLELPPHSTVLDPWNGAGTTTTMAARKGLKATGRDLNPVMAIVAQARALKTGDADILLPLAELLLRSPPRQTQSAPGTTSPSSILSVWFDDASADIIREIAASIRIGTIGGVQRVRPSARYCHLSAISAALYVALFSAVRSFMGEFRTSNPTWSKHPDSPSQRLGIGKRDLMDVFLARVADATRHALDHGIDDAAPNPCIETKQAATKSRKLADLIVTSPPYCTRLDYAHMTSLEMGVIGLTLDEYSRIRRAMTGTSLTSHVVNRQHVLLGSKTKSLLQSVKHHASRASSGYYYASHLDYYNKTASALRSLAGQTHSNSSMVMVVQDSWYKDIHNDVPALITEMAAKVGFSPAAQIDFPVKRSLADVHPHRLAYKAFRPLTESVLVFRRSNAH